MAVQPPQAPCYQLPAHLVLNALNSFSLFDLFDDALANLFCLHTYVHGTSPRNYYGIVLGGADPRLGGREDLGEGGLYRAQGRERPHVTEEDAENWNSRGKFYVLNDDINMTVSGYSAIDVPLARSFKKTAPRTYALMCTAGELLPVGARGFQKVVGIISSLFLSIFSPTLKLRFRPEETAGRFERDVTHAEGNIAFFTSQPITADHIGLYGTFAHAFSGNLLGRICNDPWRFAEGLAEIVLVVALTTLAASTLATSSTAATVLAVLLTCETAVCIGRIAAPLLFGLLSQLPSTEAISRFS